MPCPEKFLWMQGLSCAKLDPYSSILVTECLPLIFEYEQSYSGFFSNPLRKGLTSSSAKSTDIDENHKHEGRLIYFVFLLKLKKFNLRLASFHSLFLL